MQSLSILIANIVMSGRSGTEVITRMIAEGLLNLGHRPVVYTASIGALAHELRAISIPVVDDITQLNRTPDIIHGHHNPTAAAAIARFPDTPALFVCHDFVTWHSAPPALPQIRQYVAVSEATADRLVAEHGVAPSRVEILHNCVNTRRFVPTRSLPAKPQRVLAYSNYAAHRDAVIAACRSRGLELDFVGLGSGQFSDQPEMLLPNYDIVVTSGLGAIEAMSCGVAVILCDGRGLAGMITEEQFDSWRRANFGLRVLRRPVTAELMAAEIDRYNPESAGRVSARLRAEADIDLYLSALCRLYGRILDEKASAFPPSRTETHTALARHIQTWAPHEGSSTLIMHERLRLLEATLQVRAGLWAVEIGRTYHFHNGGDSCWHGLYGFSVPEEWGVWSDGPESIMLLLLKTQATRDIILSWRVRGYIREQHSALQCRVFVNGHSLATWHFAHPEDTDRAVTRTLQVPPDVGTLLYIRFAMRKPASPRQLGVSDDARLLGIGFEALTVAST